MTSAHSNIQLCTSQAAGAVSNIAKAAAKQATNAAKEIVDNSSIFPQSVSNDVASNKSDASVMSELDELAQLTEEAEEKNSVSGLVDIIKGLITALQGILGANVADSVDNNKKVEATDKTQTTNKTTNSTDENKPEVGEVVDVTIPGVGKVEDAEYMDKSAMYSWFESIGYQPSYDNNRMHVKNVDMDEVGGAYKIKSKNGSEKIYIVNKNGEIMNTISVSEGTGANTYDFYHQFYIKNGENYRIYGTQQGYWEGAPNANMARLVAMAVREVDKDGKRVS